MKKRSAVLFSIFLFATSALSAETPRGEEELWKSNLQSTIDIWETCQSNVMSNGSGLFGPELHFCHDLIQPVVDKHLETFLRQTLSTLAQDTGAKDRLVQSQRDWEVYLKSRCELGGAFAPTAVAQSLLVKSCRIRATIDRIKDLKVFFAKPNWTFWEEKPIWNSEM